MKNIYKNKHKHKHEHDFKEEIFYSNLKGDNFSSHRSSYFTCQQAMEFFNKNPNHYSTKMQLNYMSLLK